VLSPVAKCENNKCVIGEELNCEVFCEYVKKENEPEMTYSENVAQKLNTTINELIETCKCR